MPTPAPAYSSALSRGCVEQLAEQSAGHGRDMQSSVLPKSSITGSMHIGGCTSRPRQPATCQLIVAASMPSSIWWLHSWGILAQLYAWRLDHHHRAADTPHCTHSTALLPEPCPQVIIPTAMLRTINVEHNFTSYVTVVIE
jgi:hypothetical protein